MANKPAKKAAKAADPFADLTALELPADVIALQKSSSSRAPAAKFQRSPRQTKRYVQITEKGTRGFEVLGSSAAPVWFEILYRVWRTGRTTIDLPNQTLAKMGMSRFAKYRAVRRLEQAGLIEVERAPRKTLRITLLSPECVVFRRKYVRDPH